MKQLHFKLNSYIRLNNNDFNGIGNNTRNITQYPDFVSHWELYHNFTKLE